MLQKWHCNHSMWYRHETVKLLNETGGGGGLTHKYNVMYTYRRWWILACTITRQRLTIYVENNTPSQTIRVVSSLYTILYSYYDKQGRVRYIIIPRVFDTFTRIIYTNLHCSHRHTLWSKWREIWEIDERDPQLICTDISYRQYNVFSNKIRPPWKHVLLKL